MLLAMYRIKKTRDRKERRKKIVVILILYISMG
jgi:hypothetical protein